MNNPHQNARLTVYAREQIVARARQPAFGPGLPLTTQAEFGTARVCAAVYGWAQRPVQVTADWSAAQGLPEATASLPP